MNLKRIFIAVNLPEKIKEEIDSELLGLIPKKECRVVARENLHVTMKFLGYLDEKNVENVKKKMQEVDSRPFEALIGEAGDFNARVLWLGFRRGNEEFVEISRQLDKLLELKHEHFHPHITLARNKAMQRAEVKRVVEAVNAKKYSTSFRVEAIDLMLSRLSNSGAVYTRLFTASL